MLYSAAKGAMRSGFGTAKVRTLANDGAPQGCLCKTPLHATPAPDLASNLVHLGGSEGVMRQVSQLRKQVTLLVVVLCATGLLAQESSPSEQSKTANPEQKNVSLNPAELVRRTVQNEINAVNNAAPEHFMFRSHKEGPQGSQVKLYVETKEGTAGMLVAINGQPLNEAQRQDEEQRVQRFLNDPQELQKKRKKEKEDAEHTLQIMRALPDAFLYEPDGTVTGTAGVGAEGDELVRLKFRPNPRYSPPTHTEQVLTGMEGHLLIDANRCRIAEIDGTLFRQVEFGWGILGHLDKGGHFLVNQGEVGGSGWDVTRMTLNFSGKIMLFKSLHIQSTETYSDFRQVPKNLTFAEGVQVLKKEGPFIAENHAEAGGR